MAIGILVHKCNDEQAGKVYHLYREETVIGRKSDADIRLPDGDEKLSREHAVILRSDSSYYFRDQSRNGSRINSYFVYQKELESGDVIRLSNQELEFQVVDDASAEEEEPVHETADEPEEDTFTGAGESSTAIYMPESGEVAGAELDAMTLVRKLNGAEPDDVSRILKNLVQKLQDQFSLGWVRLKLSSQAPCELDVAGRNLMETKVDPEPLARKACKNLNRILIPHPDEDPDLGPYERACWPLVHERKAWGWIYLHGEPTLPLEALQAAESLAVAIPLGLKLVKGLLVSAPASSVNIIVKSEATRRNIREARKLAERDYTVLISGPTGAGKELFARLIHEHSARRNKPFKKIACNEKHDHGFVDYLFGHVPGAYTGATDRKKGALEDARGGTIFLDEIHTLSIDCQDQLLRALQDMKFERLGSSEEITFEARFLVATNQDLVVLADEGKFKADLYSRIAQVKLEIPPLKRRPEDIPELLDYYFEQYARPHSPQVKGFSKQAKNMLMKFDWPGNVRQLENVVRMAEVNYDLEDEGGDYLDVQHLPEDVKQPSGSGGDEAGFVFPTDQVRTDRELLSEYYWFVAHQFGLTHEESAKKIGVSRPTFSKYFNMKKETMEGGDAG